MHRRLVEVSAAGHTSWSCGAMRFHRDYPCEGRSLYVAVQCRFGNQAATQIALLDTAAAWSVISGATAQILQDDMGPSLGSERIMTWHGDYVGQLTRLAVHLPAEAGWGEDLAIDATCLVVSDWPLVDVIAFRGCLERVRLALDPGDAPNAERLYFGPVT